MSEPRKPRRWPLVSVSVEFQRPKSLWPRLTKRVTWQIVSVATLWLAIALAEEKFGWHARPHSLLRYLTALAPTAPLIWWAWLMVTPVALKDDEFQRLIWARTASASMALTLVIVVGWSFLSHYAGVSAPEPAVIVLLMMAANIPAQIFAGWKYR